MYYINLTRNQNVDKKIFETLPSCSGTMRSSGLKHFKKI